ncbi:hypothetical protein MLD38_018882 [Melastoma candidum]|uniref:Uncharacterized protein n=1 Tax=Melastoma candidum TaxID=119954 RepID=A0ACB9QYA4_9MYRT|nr:hypothetical protein MLD38_018882 [Melastoma candidum]
MAAPAAAFPALRRPQLTKPISDSDSDSDDSGSGSVPVRHADLSASIFRSYVDQQASSESLSKIQSLLASSSSGGLSCLICLSRIKPSDPIWSCSLLCFSPLHLPCIQSWAQQCFLHQSQPTTWTCPKCRSPYPKSLVPKSYFCFCGKLQDPPSDDPWKLPHSCGEVCDKLLNPNCGHRCLLLCHPGPCPSCPQSVEAACFCGKTRDVRRCSHKYFSCGKKCGCLLDCGVHSCKGMCHEGVCPPCKEIGVYRCHCGRVKEEKECCDRDFRCDADCRKLLACGKHVCEKGCHGGECGGCPYQGKRSCPCGKRVYDDMPCDVDVPLCGGTCDKMLSCGFHRCPERCHRGPCIETCRIVVTKSCRCGSLRKEVPCYQDLSCERKCMRMRDCGRHACKRRCCGGDCPPCSEICEKKLMCRNHRCPSPCHRGPCTPCPLMVTISCACGQTQYEVPCGTEMDQKPPGCRKPCGITQLCRHASISKPHKCHYGACPQCKLTCDEEYPCGHRCKLRCHGARPPPNPEFTVRPKKKKLARMIEHAPGTPCPPCPELNWRPCVGQHVGAERMMVCSDRRKFYCDNLCGHPLSCGNHFCTKSCHTLLVSQSPTASGNRFGESCEECSLPCQKERIPKCQHPCPLPCHPGECPLCKVLVKRSCHCGSLVHVFECIYFNSLSNEEQLTARSCGGPCHRKLPHCYHLCPETCHPGECSSPEKCSKKVGVRCECGTLKREWSCQEVQAAYRTAGRNPGDISKNLFGHGLLPCGSDCKKKVQAVVSEVQQRKPKKFEANEPQTEKRGPKRRKKREMLQETKSSTTFQAIFVAMKWLLLCIVISAAVLAASYYGYKGLLHLSDWMNELDNKRQRRYPRL